MITKTVKTNQVKFLNESFSQAKASFLVNCIGLTVEEMTDLRKNLKKEKGNIQVIKNTLAQLALDSHSELKSAYGDHLKGTNAFVLAFNDVIKVAKVISKVSKQNSIFKIKCGVLDGSVVTEKEVKTLASLPSMEVLRAQWVGLLAQPLTKFLGTLQAVPGGFARLLESYKEKQK